MLSLFLNKSFAYFSGTSFKIWYNFGNMRFQMSEWENLFLKTTLWRMPKWFDPLVLSHVFNRDFVEKKPCFLLWRILRCVVGKQSSLESLSYIIKTSRLKSCCYEISSFHWSSPTCQASLILSVTSIRPLERMKWSIVMNDVFSKSAVQGALGQ